MRLPELLDITVLKKLTDANYKASGMPIGIIDAVDGSILIGVGWQEICTHYHRVHAISAERCRESDDYIKAHLTEGEPTEYRCKNGLRDIGIPIVVAGQHLATLFMGQFFYEGEETDREFFVRQARELGFDEAAYMRAVEGVPVFSRAAIENILAYNGALAQFIAETAERALQNTRAERLARDNAERFRRLVEVSAQIVWVTDARGEPVEDSPSWRAFTGRSYDQWAGWNWIDVIHPEDRERVAHVWRTAVATKTPYQVEFRQLHASGEYRNIECRAVAMLDAAGEVREWIGMNVDITERKRAEEELRKSERDLNRAQAVAQTGSWRLDVLRNELLWSAETYRMFEIPKGTPLTYEAFLARVHPADRQLVDERWSAALRGKPYELEHRIIVGDEVRWVREKAELEVDREGNLQGGFGTVQDITDSKRLQEALQSANEQLTEQGRRKDEFLAMMSHELRNPLAPIRNAVYVLQRVEPGGEQARRAQGVIDRQSEHLARIVDDLVDVSRIMRGKVELQRAQVDIVDIARRTAEDYRGMINERGLRFTVDVLPGSIWISGDETRLVQVLGNLLQNAAKFTPVGGAVGLSLVHAGDAAELRVRDTGVGIAPELLTNIFQPFTQGEQGLARSTGGLGLGLALVNALVELHGGTVTATSRGTGQGAEFTVRLPVHAGPAVAANEQVPSASGQQERRPD